MKIEDKLKAWLEKTGYPLELFVHKELRSRKFICEKSQMYSDVETGVSREIDLTANKVGPSGNGCYELQFVIECKKSDKPLVVLCDGNELKERSAIFFGSELLDDLRVGNGGIYFYIHQLDDKERQKLTGEYSKKIFPGYSIVPGFGKSDENIFKGIMGLAKANDYHRNEYLKLAKDNLKNESEENYEPWHRLQIPLLVVDAPLFRAFLNKDGELVVEKSDWESLVVRLPWVLDTDESDRVCVVDVVQRDFLNNYLDCVEKLHKNINESGVLNAEITFSASE